MFNTQFNSGLKVLSAACMLTVASGAQAAINAFSDDFEGYGTAGTPSVADFSPWFGYSDNGGFPGGYTFTPSTSGPQITALGYNGTDNQYLNFYANYDNVNVHDRVNCAPCSPNLQEQIFVYYQQTFDATDTAGSDTWVFSFNYREADVPPAGNTQVGAFIRVFDPIFNILKEVTLDTSGSAAWQEGRLSVTLDPLWVNGFFQVGFYNYTQEYEDSGMFYDDVKLVKAQPTPIAIKSIGDTLHPHHVGQMLTNGSLPDDTVRVNIFGQSTAAGDPTDLDANNVDFATLRLGPAQGAINTLLVQQTGLNLDSDGLDDAQARFSMSDLGFQCVTDTEGTLTGELTTGETFAGVDAFTNNCNAQCHN